MPREKLSAELKKAIVSLTPLEKEKLIFRLLPSNEMLVRQLEFRLLEEENTTEERRDMVEDFIRDKIDNYPTRYYSSLYLLKVVRELSAQITRHVRITKDKYGEIYLNFFMLNYTMDKYDTQLRKESIWASEKFDSYVVKRAIKLQKLMHKLHEDYILEFEDAMKTLGQFMTHNPSLKRMTDSLDFDLDAMKDGALTDQI